MALLLMCFLAIQADDHSRAILRGRVIDATSQQALAGAVIYIADLKAGTTSGQDGSFLFNDLPSNGKFLLEVRYIGYKTANIAVDLSRTKEITVRLEQRIIESQEVVITGTPFGTQAKTSSLAVSALRQNDLLRMGESNLISAVAKLPGVASVATGTAIAKPVIRGLGYNRVLTLVDGVREEGQQWGDEHGIMVDENAAARVEVLKGPASLLYGSDALGGVIQILDDLVPPPGSSNGRFNLGYQHNSGMLSSSLMWQGNDGGLVYRGRVSYKNAHGFAMPGVVVPNSGMQENAVSGSVGLRKPWGYSNLSLSRLATAVGLVEDGPAADGLFYSDQGDVISDAEAKQRSFELPFQKIEHYRAVWRSNFILGGGQLKTDFGFQRNLRGEFEETYNKPGMDLALNSYTYDVKYAFPSTNGWEKNIGWQGMYQQNSNRGDEYLIPDYNSVTTGAFIYVKKQLENFALNAGIRYDYSQISGKELIDVENGIPHQHFSGFVNAFDNFSGAAGLTWNINDQWRLRANLGTGFRAPNIAELGSNGKHEGTFRYEIGNSQLKPETSLQLDLGLNFELKNVSLELNAFQNSIYQYIYLRQLNGEQIIGTDHYGNTEVLPVYRFGQTNARLFGGEFVADFHWIKNLHWESTFAYVEGQNQSSGKPLPFIPAANWNNEVRFEPQITGLKESYLKVGLNHYFAQNRVDIFETPNAAYSLLDAGVGTTIPLGNHKISLWLSGQNLANVRYFNHLSRYKLAGIYNPGRNLGLGVVIPL
jgi:iron complex outermembrane receptor protein